MIAREFDFIDYDIDGFGPFDRNDDIAFLNARNPWNKLVLSRLFNFVNHSLQLFLICNPHSSNIFKIVLEDI